jgi:UDP-N-acetyl-D-glucosamine dehydrogenase
VQGSHLEGFLKSVAIVGQGYVGLPLAVRCAEVGMDVLGFDIHDGLVRQLNAGISHIGDVSDTALRTALKSGYEATSDAGRLAEVDVVVVCVPTPLSPDGGPDLGAVESAARMVGQHILPGTTVILESTTYPGTTEEVFAPLVAGERFRLDEDVYIAFSPERVDPGNPTYGIQNTPKVVGGLTEASTDRAVAFYSTFIDMVVPAKGAKEAELSKLLENTFRHVNIALVNEMVRFSDDLDIDLWDAINCAATKPFGFMAFRPGPGVGGHCIPVDPSYLSHRVKARLGYSFRIVELAEEINDAAPGYVADRVWRLLNSQSKAVRGSKVLLLGVTYKPNISDMRETPATPLAKLLMEWGAELAYWDPFVDEWSVENQGVVRREDPVDAAGRADVVVLLQPHALLDLAGIAAQSTPVLDTRGVLPGSDAVQYL